MSKEDKEKQRGEKVEKKVREGGRISRREFLTGIGGFAGGVLIGSGGAIMISPTEDEYICPFCDTKFDDTVSLATHLKSKHSGEFTEIKKGWGSYNQPYPEGEALITVNSAACTGCGLCEMACSYEHFDVIDRDLSRIQVYKFPTPIYTAVANTCRQCGPQEAECEKVCPPGAITWDEENKVIQVNENKCLGREDCNGGDIPLCIEACPANIPRFPDKEEVNYPLICNLCLQENGDRIPSCVDACSNDALEFMERPYPTYLERHTPEQKADFLKERQPNLPKDRQFVGEKYKELLGDDY